MERGNLRSARRVRPRLRGTIPNHGDEMRTFVTVVLAAGLAAGVTAFRPAGADGEEAAVRATLQHYIEGHRTGSAEEFRQAFHPRANLYFAREGQFMERTSADYIAGAAARAGGVAPDEAARQRRIEMVDIAGSAAVARIVLDYPEVRFTDYMSLLKVEGRWQIVAKTFHAERKAP